MNILSILSSALFPAGLDLIKDVIHKVFKINPAQARSVDEQIKLQTAEIEKLRALAELDKPAGEISRWVADLRASIRYILALIIFGLTGIVIFVNVDPSLKEAMLNLSGIVFGFFFGDRVYINLRGGKK